MTKALYDTGEISIPISCACEITRVRITDADNNRKIYIGNAEIIDHIEHGIKAKKGWKAQPGSQELKVFGKTYRMDINPTDPFWGPDIFTLQLSVDADLRHHVMHAILNYNPNLPESDK
jgi:hypothetical protein